MTETCTLSVYGVAVPVEVVDGVNVSSGVSGKVDVKKGEGVNVMVGVGVKALKTVGLVKNILAEVLDVTNQETATKRPVRMLSIQNPFTPRLNA